MTQDLPVWAIYVISGLLVLCFSFLCAWRDERDDTKRWQSSSSHWLDKVCAVEKERDQAKDDYGVLVEECAKLNASKDVRIQNLEFIIKDGKRHNESLVQRLNNAEATVFAQEKQIAELKKDANGRVGRDAKGRFEKVKA